MTKEHEPMPAEERDEMILRFLADRKAMFKPKALFENLREYEDITFGYKTVKRRLDDLEERGYVERVEESSYRRISKEGREHIREKLSDE